MQKTLGRSKASTRQGLLLVPTAEIDGAAQVDTTGSELLSAEGKNIFISETISFLSD